ncbi:hypothetical protein GTA08_BOTSDO12310 [Botryosphaeria dothidea]|uniref:Uncharacterized protein n=1 Tax=Botryosphaeria dothidea TaxID=55169 RepID=A0A8H4NEH6_9PEZI|nr:hypothetical protein GTA08_BOTSDO12310 [Botryosphaeria dothidea]
MDLLTVYDRPLPNTIGVNKLDELRNSQVPHSLLFRLPREFVHMILSYLIPSNALSHMRSPDGIKEVADLISLGLACHFTSTSSKAVATWLGDSISIDYKAGRFPIGADGLPVPTNSYQFHRPVCSAKFEVLQRLKRDRDEPASRSGRRKGTVMIRAFKKDVVEMFAEPHHL